MSQAPKPISAEERTGTLIETDDEIRQALLSGVRGQQRAVASRSFQSPVPAPIAAPQPARLATPFRPTNRPPFATLTVFDDGKPEGENIRIREPRFTIGRLEGDLRIALDSRISSKHAEISLQTVGGIHRWVVTDLQSTHGMFVRVSKSILADKAEFLVGNGRYRFELPQRADETAVNSVLNEAGSGETRGWGGVTSPYRPPALTELVGNEIGNRVLLVKPEYWIGSDPICPISRTDDPFCELKHVRVYRGQKESWHVEHNKTQNGLWLRMSQIVAESMIQFQIGEQRFRLRVE